MLAQQLKITDSSTNDELKKNADRQNRTTFSISGLKAWGKVGRPI